MPRPSHLQVRPLSGPLLGRFPVPHALTSVGVDVLDMPFTLPAPSAKSWAGFFAAPRPLIIVLRTEGPTALAVSARLHSAPGGRVRSSAPWLPNAATLARVDQPCTVLHDSRRTEISHFVPPLSMQVDSETTTSSRSSAAMLRTIPFATPHILRLEVYVMTSVVALRRAHCS